MVGFRFDFCRRGRSSIFEVLEGWTRGLTTEFDAVQLFDLPSGASIYRVFLLPGCPQFDLSFTPASQFGTSGPKFRLLVGSSVEKPSFQPPPAQEFLFFRSFLVMPSTKPYACVFVSNPNASGRPSIGSEAFATAPFTSHAAEGILPG